MAAIVRPLPAPQWGYLQQKSTHSRSSGTIDRFSRLRKGQLSIAADAHSIAGSIANSVVITGDGNTIHVFEDIEPDELREMLQQAVQSLRISALLAYEQFAERTVKKANDLKKPPHN